MFTGIVEEMGEIGAVEPGDQLRRLEIRARRVCADLSVGDSIAVDGVCLTVVESSHREFRVDVGAETLRRTTLTRLTPGAVVNLERAVRSDQRLGGHLVQGHVDGMGTVLRIRPEGSSFWTEVALSAHLQPYVAEKGSIAVDGVSLTVAGLTPEGFAVALIPYTLDVTTLGRRRVGDAVNIEVDIVAKYLERLAAAYLDAGRRADDERRAFQSD